MIAACGDTATGVRSKAMIAVLYGYGIKIGAACDLRAYDSLPRGARDEWANLVNLWSSVRRALVGGRNDGYMFIAVSGDSLGNPTSPSYWRHTLPRISAKAGIASAISPQDLVASGRLERVAAEVRRDG